MGHGSAFWSGVPEIYKAGVLVAAEPRLNFIQGSNITLTVADNPSNGRVDVTIASTASGSVDGSGAATRLAYWSDSDSLTSNAGLTFDGTILAAITINLTNPLAIGHGGTGQTTKTAAFDALSPTTTKGDIIVDNGTNDIRLAVGANDSVLTADSTAASGVKWATPAVSSGGADHSCRLYHSSSQAIATSTFVKLAFNSERWDPDGWHSTVTNNSRITPGVVGRYILGFCLEIGGNANGQRDFLLKINNAKYLSSYTMPVSSAGYAWGVQTGGVEWDVTNAADYAEIEVYQDSGSSLNITASDGTNNWYGCDFWCRKVDKAG